MLFVIESAEPDNVTARSVEFGNISLATCILAPVIWIKQIEKQIVKLKQKRYRFV